MAKIFISYRRSDSITIAGRLYDHLAQAFKPQNIFKDVDNIPPGSDFRKVLEDEVSACDVLLVVIGRSWVDIHDETGKRRLDDPDDFVRLEIGSGLKRDDVLVIPVLVDNAKMPDISQLPQELQELPFLNAVSVRNDPDFKRDMQRLIQYIDNATQIQTRNRLMPVLVAGSILIILVIAFVLWSASKSENPTVASASSPSPTLGARDFLYQTQTVEAESARLATLEAEIGSLALTSTATLWTATPTNTPTPTATFTPTPTNTPSANDWVEQGNLLAQRGNIRDSLEAFEQAVRLEPDNEEAHELIGHNAFAIGDYELAAQGFSEAFRLNPDNFAGAVGTGDAYLALGDFNKALEAWDATVEQFPDNRIVRFKRGQTLVELNRRNEAIEEFTFVIESAPLNGDVLMEDALITRGYQNIERGWFQSAINDFQQLADYNPDNLIAWLEIGYNQERLGNFEAAIEAFAQVLAREPDNFDAIVVTAIMHRNLEQFTRQASFISNIFDEGYNFTNEQLANLYWLRAEAYLLMNAGGLAVDDLRRAVELDETTNQGAALVNLGWTLADLGDTTGGITYLQRYVEVAEANNFPINQDAVNKLRELENR